MLNVLDLFSGIGGFSLGLESTKNFKTIGFVEYDEHAQKILRKHWPETPIFKDVRFFSRNSIAEKVDIITGGFPCQDLSSAGKKAGIEKGERSGLWKEFFRIICEFRPKYVLVENVPNLIIGESGRWMGVLLRDLASIGYDAQWHCISASDVGGGHERKRIWIIAYPNKIGWDVPFKIYNSISNQIRNCRTSRQTLSLLAKVKQLRFEKDGFDHRKLNGISDAVDRLERLGNSIIPKIPHIIGNAISLVEK